LEEFGRRILLVTGHHAFDASEACRGLLEDLQGSFELQRLRVDGEPSPTLVDEAVAEFRAFQPDAVLGVGGGSAIDAAKAIAGLLPLGHSVFEFLEGVGRGKTYPGPALPFVAVPTTAGTGGETSKNAVLSVCGEGGFKKSFRHEKLVARAVINDPELHLGCPPGVTASCGMDALTQLLESYVSSRASPMTDALAWSGLEKAVIALPRVIRDGSDLEARGEMAYAATISGLTLANAGLGSVHGLASPLGAFFPIPHGVACGTLVADAVRINIQALRPRAGDHPALERYARIGRLFADDPELPADAACEHLIRILAQWRDDFGLNRLSDYGVREEDIPRLVQNCRGHSMQTNPIELTDEEVAALIRSRL